MPEKDVIASTTGLPATVDSLAEDLRNLGVKPGMVLFVHSSLSSLGWVCGNETAVILALENVLTSEGTLVMPTFTGELTDPAGWIDPPVPDDWKQLIRDNMPAFDPDLTPCPRVGRIPETFRKQKGVIRCNHPLSSFAAWGKHAELITSPDRLEYPLQDPCSLTHIYDLDGMVLLIGVDYFRNTSMHLAEYRADYRKKETKLASPMTVDGKRVWVEYDDIENQYTHFQDIGEAFESETAAVTIGKVAQAETRIFPIRACVDFTVKWFEKNLI